MILILLFWTFLKLSLFAFGGGISAVALIEHQVVQNLHWLTQKDFLNLIAFLQVVPGNLSANLAIMIGFKEAGFFGGLCSLLGFSFFALLLVTFFARFLYRWRYHYTQRALFFGIVPAILSLILYTCIVIGKFSLTQDNTTYLFTFTILFSCILSQFFFRFPSMLTLLIGALLGMLFP